MYSELQKIAYHEAAHAVACLEFGIPFREVAMIKDGDSYFLSNEEKLTGMVEFGRDIRYEFAGKRNAHHFLIMFLAAILATAEMEGHKTYEDSLKGNGLASDWDAVGRFIDLDATFRKHKKNPDLLLTIRALGIPPKKLSPKQFVERVQALISKAEKFMEENSKAVIKLGDALIASPVRKLSYRQCQRILKQSATKVAA